MRSPGPALEPKTAPRLEAVSTPLASSLEPSASKGIRLRLLAGGGPKDVTFPVANAGVIIGRSQGHIQFGEDPFLSPVHVKLLRKDGQIIAADAGSLNGTFLRVRERSPIGKGSEFMVGGQRFLLLGVGGPTRDVRTEGEHNARPLGGPVPKELFAALRQLHAAADGQALAGSVLLRSGPVIAIGQRGCDIEFPRDSAMCTHHAELHLKRGESSMVEVQGPVYIKLVKPTVLRHGDELRLGEELLRVEML